MTRARGRDADMTQGNILRQYIDFALPLTVGLLFQQLYSAVDSIVVGNFVGETALGQSVQRATLLTCSSAYATVCRLAPGQSSVRHTARKP